MLAQQISQLARRRPGAGLRRAEICRARSGRSGRGGGAQHLARRYPHRVAKANSNTPVGTIAGERQNITLSASRRMTKAEDYSKVIVAYRNGAPVKLDEIADVIDSVENNKIASLFNGERARSCWRSSASPMPTRSRSSTQCKAALPAYRAQIPAADQHGGFERSLDLDPRSRSTMCRRRC